MRSNKKEILSILAFFAGVCFLYTVSLSNINVNIGSALSGSEHIKLYILECVSAGIGFLYCPVILNKPGGGAKWRRLVLIICAILFVISTLIITFVTSGPVMRLSVVFEMLSMGIVAGYGYVILSSRANTVPAVGMIVAGGYSIAILAQFIFQLELDLGILFTILEIVVCLIIVWYEIRFCDGLGDEDGLAQADAAKDAGSADAAKDADSADAGSEDASGTPTTLSHYLREIRPRGGAELIRLIVISTCLLALSSYIDGQMSVTFDVSSFFTWPRLMFIPGSLLMGLAWSHRKLRIAPIVMLLSAVAAFLMPVLLTDEAFYGLDMCVFYLYIGICMTYLTLAFMKYADISGNPFAAVMFRGLDNITTVMFIILGLGRISVIAMIIVDVALLVIIVALMWIGGDFESTTGYELGFFKGIASGSNDLKSDITDDERIKRFADRYGLTEREGEVLKLLLTMDEKGEVMAKELGVSRRGFVCFTTSIYQKTQTGSRIGLMQKYMSE